MTLIGSLGERKFVAAQVVATLIAMASNFLLNNEITYRANRYRGLGLIVGFAQFAVLCSIGALANIDIASSLFRRERLWWAAGLAGALIGVVWNYAASSIIVWRKRRKS
jgi:dolichol-phosphate mannosyltransferase